MRILFIKPSSLGDILHGLQLAESLRQDLPGLHISWVAREIFAPLVEACKTVDKVYVFERKGGLASFLKLAMEIRKDKFDWVIDLQGLFRSGLLTFLAQGSHKAGRSDTREGAGLFYRQKAKLPEGGKNAHALEILLQFRDFFGLPAEFKGVLEFESKLPQNFPASTDGSITYLFFPESRRPEKEWLYFQQITSTLLNQDPDCRIVWAGSGKLAHPRSFPDDRFANLSGHTPLNTLPAMINASDCVLANDSGPMHLAAALAKPVLALFGPTPPERFGPYPTPGGKSKVLRAPGGDLEELSTEEVLKVLVGMTSDTH